ncbi:MAG: DUF4058 family protein, partial [bacterium]|nr:DUF4058 family protein [bacterium]
MPEYPHKLVELLTIGPFPGRMDPWVEDPHYFEQIHSGIIHQMVEQIRPELLARGYYAALETSLQIENRREEPDIYVGRNRPQVYQSWDYAAAAEALKVEPGLETLDFKVLKAVFIHDQFAKLVTVVEVISPGNKTTTTALRYREFRTDLLKQGVNFVEIDITRSLKRMMENQWTTSTPYHVAVYLPEAVARVIGMDFDQPLKPFALPLRGEAIAIDTHSAYEKAYRSQGIAAQMEANAHYTLNQLPFPPTLAEDARQALIAQANDWLKQFEHLR